MVAYTTRPFLASNSYAPTVRATPATSSATLAAVDSDNANTGPFLVPSSGSVIVTATFLAQVATSGDRMAFSLGLHGSVAGIVNPITFANNNTILAQVVRWKVTGLTAGTTQTIDLLFSSLDAVSVTLYILGEVTNTPDTLGGPLVMTVEAA